MKPVREKDGRFKPRTGLTLPPKKQQPRDENGVFIPRDKVTGSKPYSKAVRELLGALEGGLPEGWDHAKLTEAQSLAMVHMAQAKGGNVQIGMVIIDRAEGKVPQAAEDREAAIKAGEGVAALASLLGIDMRKVIDTEVIEDAVQLHLPEPTHPGGAQGDSAPAPEGAGDVDRAGEPTGEASVEGTEDRVEGVSESSSDADFAEWLRSGGSAD